MTLIIVTTAIKNEPHAREPRWNLNAHLAASMTPCGLLPSPVSEPCPEKYQRQVEQHTTKS